MSLFLFVIGISLILDKHAVRGILLLVAAFSLGDQDPVQPTPQAEHAPPASEVVPEAPKRLGI